MSLSSLPIDEAVTRYLYGTPTLPTDFSDAGLIRPTTVTPPPSVDVDLTSYMNDGPGRFALPALFEVVSDFFNDTTLAANSSFDLAGMKSHYGLTDPVDLRIAQWEYADGTDDYDDRVFVWGSSKFKISPNAEFVVDATGHKQIENFYVTPFEHENFDFEGGNPLENILNFSYLEPRIDPWGVGRKLYIEFDGTPTEFTYTETLFAGDNATMAGWSNPGPILGAAQALLVGLGAVPALFDAGITKPLVDDLPVQYGTLGDDEIYTVALAGDPMSGDLADSGQVVVAGAGNDTVYGAYGGSGADMRIFGGDGSDVVTFEDMASSSNPGGGAIIHTDHVETLVGSTFDDQIALDPTTGMTVDGGGGNDVVSLETWTSGVSITVASGAQPLAGHTLSNVESIAGTSFADTLMGGQGNQGLAGGGGADSVAGGDGADSLVGGGGDDTILGGSGDDQLQYAGDANGFDVVDGGAGSDDAIVATAANTVIGLTSLTGIERVSTGGFANVVAQGDAGDNVFDLSNIFVDGVSFSGGAGNDLLIASNNLATSYSYLLGDGGNDTLSGGIVSSLLIGGDGDDTYNLAGDSYAIDGEGDNTWVLPFESGISSWTTTAAIDGVNVYLHEANLAGPRIVAYPGGVDTLMVGSTTITTLNIEGFWSQIQDGFYWGEHVLAWGTTNSSYDFVLDAYIDPNDERAHVLLSFTGDISDAWLDTSLDLQEISDVLQSDVLSSVRIDDAFWSYMGLTINQGNLGGGPDLEAIALYGPSNYNAFLA